MRRGDIAAALVAHTVHRAARGTEKFESFVIDYDRTDATPDQIVDILKGRKD